jgi:alpha-glucosidase
MTLSARTSITTHMPRLAWASLTLFILSGFWSVTSAQTPSHDTAMSRANGIGQHSDDPWWKHAVFYEIYPRSFQDSDGDGIGDLNGITQRLDYLQSLGVDAIWLSPIYPSPQVDFGYDISDYENIDPQYGTLADFDRLVAEAKKRNIRILMDMVMNHTSDKHKWFVESASSKDNPKRDWYIWRDGKPGGTPPNNPPNNWISEFGHSAWQYDPKTNQYYYHRFYAQQPDLNWRNPAVEKAMFDSVRFWLDRGVAGFRFDAIPTLFEDPALRDAKELEGTNAYGDRKQEHDMYDNLPEVHDVMRRLRTLADQYPGDRVLIGETYLPNIQELDKWYGGARRDELQLPMDMQVGFTNKLDANLLRQRINDAETKIHDNQPLFVFDNHDNIRSWDRYGDGVHNEAIAKLIATLLLTSRSTALMYYGEELGMVTTPPTRVEDVKDPIGVTGWPQEKGRDGERTPMQWDNSKNAGFSTSNTTWLPAPPSYHTTNAKMEENQPNSLLNWHKQLIALRRTDPALRNGNMVMIDVNNPSVLSFIRQDAAGKPSILVSLNCTSQPQPLFVDPTYAKALGQSVQTVLTSDPSLQHVTSLSSITLPPYGSWIGRLK